MKNKGYIYITVLFTLLIFVVILFFLLDSSSGYVRANQNMENSIQASLIAESHINYFFTKEDRNEIIADLYQNKRNQRVPVDLSGLQFPLENITKGEIEVGDKEFNLYVTSIYKNQSQTLVANGTINEGVTLSGYKIVYEELEDKEREIFESTVQNIENFSNCEVYSIDAPSQIIFEGGNLKVLQENFEFTIPYMRFSKIVINAPTVIEDGASLSGIVINNSRILTNSGKIFGCYLQKGSLDPMSNLHVYGQAYLYRDEPNITGSYHNNVPKEILVSGDELFQIKLKSIKKFTAY